MKSCITQATSSPTVLKISEEVKDLTLNSSSNLPSSSNSKITYVIQPPNYGQLKVIHNETKDIVPQLSISFESSDLKLYFDKLQLKQSIKALSSMQRSYEKMHLLSYRPRESALSKPWDWWSYAFIALSNNPELFVNKVC